MKQSWTMRRRLMLAFAAFTLFVALLFSAIAVLFLYTVEDRFFSDALQSEAKNQIEYHQEFDRWASPRSGGRPPWASLSASPRRWPT